MRIKRSTRNNAIICGALGALCFALTVAASVALHLEHTWWPGGVVGFLLAGPVNFVVSERRDRRRRACRTQTAKWGDAPPAPPH